MAARKVKSYKATGPTRAQMIANYKRMHGRAPSEAQLARLRKKGKR